MSATVKEFIAKFKNWDEMMSTSPSGMNLSHYHAMIKPHSVSEKDNKHAEMESQRMELIAAHVALINCTAKFGCACNRWKTIVNVMLLKKPGNYKVHKLRVIHLCKADYSTLLGMFWRKASHNAADNNLTHEGHHGGRPRRTAHRPAAAK